ncbi:hypothetical protein MA16_Dca008078 [Dendrobium catenatum]|uniref:Uncharacterized protein n=1 Tax=Dendrobium catenatum TaxID=906689 RepID=A0A2I0WCX5_9ASPA|nr:hypothetical protein MA16_Dca008078 [Dendrobium catenatum]
MTRVPGDEILDSRLFLKTEQEDTRSEGMEAGGGFRSTPAMVATQSLSLMETDDHSSPCNFPENFTSYQIEAEDAKDDEFEGGSDAECPDETYLSKITEMRLVPHDPNQYTGLVGWSIFCQVSDFCICAVSFHLEQFYNSLWVVASVYAVFVHAARLPFHQPCCKKLLPGCTS